MTRRDRTDTTETIRYTFDKETHLITLGLVIWGETVAVTTVLLPITPTFHRIMIKVTAIWSADAVAIRCGVAGGGMSARNEGVVNDGVSV